MPRRPARNDLVVDAVQIGQPLLPVVLVLLQNEVAVLLIADELERSRPDRLRPHVRRQHPAGIDLRLARREPPQPGRTRTPLPDLFQSTPPVDHVLEASVPDITRTHAPLLAFPFPLPQSPVAFHPPRP